VTWFDYGKKLAHQAKRLSSDSFYNTCVKAEAKISHGDADTGWKAGMKEYCSADFAFKNGADGLSHNFEFCGAGKSSKIQSAYKKGIAKFCQPASAYEFGKRGGIYSNKCTKAQEIAWMPAYKKGRRIYLEGELHRAEREVIDFDTETRDLESDRSTLSRKFSLIPPSEVSTTTRKWDPVTKTYQEVRTLSEDDETVRQRERLSNELENLERRIYKARANRDRAKEKLRNLEAELNRLQ